MGNFQKVPNDRTTRLDTSVGRLVLMLEEKVRTDLFWGGPNGEELIVDLNGPSIGSVSERPVNRSGWLFTYELRGLKFFSSPLENPNELLQEFNSLLLPSGQSPNTSSATKLVPGLVVGANSYFRDLLLGMRTDNALDPLRSLQIHPTVRSFVATAAGEKMLLKHLRRRATLVPEIAIRSSKVVANVGQIIL